MAGLIPYVYEKTRRYYRYIFAFLLLGIFIAAAYYVYYTYFTPSQNAKKFIDAANSEDRLLIAEIYFFHADWCPHCTKAQPEWNTFVQKYDKKVINGYTIYCVDVNCTDDQGDVPVPKVINDHNAVNSETGEKLGNVKYEITVKPTPIKVENLIRNFNIDSYPTIKLQKDNYTIDFQSKITEASLTKFVNTVLNS
jgi:thiol-disulfide isomerase/thioredoxin